MIPDLRRHYRFLAAFVLGAFAGLLTWWLPGVDRLLVFADSFFLTYLALAWWQVRRMTTVELRAHADDDDEGMWLIVLIAVSSVLVGLVANVMTLSDPHGGVWARPVMALIAVPLGWAMIHTVMAFHYASLWYVPKGTGYRCGLGFPGLGEGDEAGIWDFLYYSFTLGMTAQTSDTAVTLSAMRRVTLLHSALSFFYNTVILALAVNAAVSLGQ
ncbi:DUF1345 domain-containing protein [Paracoccus limosus]|uniref:DUF1345 domain-containing protein n=1 Tax=Paracoccus limosus TaxID=913252 RepID=A0A844H6W5_9RHOB|nr:DUF1345 domain-containing protein [Paracoccus limosus]